jgi:hypothetical protein
LFGQCPVQEVAFQTGEKITWEVAYNWGFIWVDAGEVYFKTDTSVFNDKKIYRFEAYGTSYQYYDWLYKVRDLYQSKVEIDSFQPLWFLRKTNEGSHEVFNECRFKPEEQNVIVSIKHTNELLKTDTLPLDNCRFDVLSAVYFARTINFNLYQMDEKIPVKILIDDDFYETHVRYLGKEIIRNRSGKKYRCHKMSALLVEGTIFKGGEDLVVWVTDDENKIPVMADAKILIGSVKAYLTGYEGLKYKMEAEVEEKSNK